MTGMTVRRAVLDLLRAQGVTTVFGNPGSTELTFLHDWPNDLQYVLGLQEASVVAMADGFAQATRRPAFVNLHSAAGVGHALGNIFTAFRNQTPLVVTAGQQARSLLSRAPYLFAERATEFPQPYVKWSNEPARAEDVPAAIAHAFAIAMTPPCGPTFVSIPVDDWARPCTAVAPRVVMGRTQPDPVALDELARALVAASRPAIIVGPEVDRDNAWASAVAVAERLRVPVYASPTSSRASFPEDHALFAGFLPAAPEPLADMLAGFDLLAVFGAPVFTFHVEGHCRLFDAGGPAIHQVTQDPAAAAAAGTGMAILGSVHAALDALLAKLPEATRPMPPGRGPAAIPPSHGALTAERVLHRIAAAMPDDALIAEEAPSHRTVIQRYLPIRRPHSFFTMASGGLGYSLPAAVGLALASPGRHVIAIIGDGSMMYSIQALYTAAQLRLPLTVVVLNNGGYGAMRAFSQMTGSHNVPGIDLPGLDFTSLAVGHGCSGIRVESADAFGSAFDHALRSDGPWVIDAVVDPSFGELYSSKAT